MTMNGHKKGFRLPVQTATLKFEGDYEGLEVVCRLNVPLSTYLEFTKLADLGDEEGVAQIRSLGDYFGQFSEHVLVSWNLEDSDGQPIQPRPDGLVKAPVELAMIVLSEWLKAVKASPLAQTTPASLMPSASAGGRPRARS